MADRPILFSAPMIRAILDGWKTQTRRVLKPQPPQWATFCQELKGLYVSRGWAPSGLWQWCEPETNPPQPLRRWPVHESGPMEGIDYGMRMTYARGDLLWVREAWRTPINWDDRSPKQIEASCLEAGFERAWCPIQWEADGTRTNWADWREHGAGRCRVSMHLPRVFSRITLRVTDVRVERLQDISRGDAMLEGCPFPNMKAGPNPRDWFRDLWNEINGPGSWKANPWVAAYTFEPIFKNIDEVKA